MNRSRLTRILFFGTLGAALLLVLFVPRPVAAGWFDFDPALFITFIIRAVGSILIFIVGIFLWFAGQFVDWMMILNANVLSGGSDSFVFIGWKILRDLTNLGFVLIIILIAFATILRQKQYGAQQLLPKLIAAAILVNFSLLIAGVFIDFSNILTNFFLENSGIGNAGISMQIGGAFNPQRLITSTSEIPLLPDAEASAFVGFSGAVLTSIANVVFGIIFTLLAAIVMLALAIMLLVRYVALTILLVVSPIIWLFWVVPGLSSHFNKWWSEFLKWVFFAPIVSFFIYLTLVSLSELDAGDNAFRTSGLGGLTAVLMHGGHMVAVSGLLVGGLIAAEKMGIVGAKTAMSAVKGVEAGTKKWAANKVERGGALAKKGFSRAAIATGAAGAVESAGNALESFGSTSAWYNPVGRLAGGVGKKLKGASDTMLDSATSELPQSKSLLGTAGGGALKGVGIYGRNKKVKEWLCHYCGYSEKSAREPGWECSKFTTATHTGPPKWDAATDSD